MSLKAVASPCVFGYIEMNTVSQIHNIHFWNHSYMFRLPQYNHHQAVENHKKEIILHRGYFIIIYYFLKNCFPYRHINKYLYIGHLFCKVKISPITFM